MKNFCLGALLVLLVFYVSFQILTVPVLIPVFAGGVFFAALSWLFGRLIGWFCE